MFNFSFVYFFNEKENVLLLLKSLENVFLHLCYEDQRRTQEENPMKNPKEIVEKETNEMTSISPIEVPQPESRSSQIRRKELAKNRSFEEFQFQNRNSRPFSALYLARRAALDCCTCPHSHKIYALMVKDLTVIKRNIGFALTFLHVETKNEENKNEFVLVF